MHKLKVLICDDMAHVRLAHEEALIQCGKNLFHPITTEAECGEKAVETTREAIASGAGFDLVLMDIDFSEARGSSINGFEALEQIHALLPDTVVAVVSSYGTEDNYHLAAKAKHVEKFFRRGSFDLGELKSLCEYALVRSLHTKGALLPPDKVAFTQATVMKEYLAKIDQTPANESVFVYGETGTGKELTARRLNANARVLTGNANRPLVTLNCGSIAPTLLMGELFGHARGAFTGADRDREGWLEKADGGDIFLDELQNASSEFQQALLVFLQTGEFSRVGETRTRKVNARVIAAFNQDPIEAIRTGKLREDLFGRLQKNYIIIPPLRERVGDIPALVAHFQSLFGKADKTFSSEVNRFLESLPWKTNVREVKAVVEAAIHQSRLPVITVADLRELPIVQKILSEIQKSANYSTPVATLQTWETKAADLFDSALESGLSFHEIINAIEKVAFLNAVKEQGAIIKMAKRFRIPESTVRKKLKRYALTSTTQRQKCGPVNT